MKKSAYRKWIFSVLVVFLQAVIEKLPDYQNEIESWGYQVSVLPKMTGEPKHAGLMRYYLESAGPPADLQEKYKAGAAV